MRLRWRFLNMAFSLFSILCWKHDQNVSFTIMSALFLDLCRPSVGLGQSLPLSIPALRIACWGPCAYTGRHFEQSCVVVVELLCELYTEHTKDARSSCRKTDAQLCHNLLVLSEKVLFLSLSWISPKPPEYNTICLTDFSHN